MNDEIKKREEKSDEQAMKPTPNTSLGTNKPLIIGLACIGGLVLIIVSISATLLFHTLRLNLSSGVVHQPGILRHIGTRGHMNYLNRQATNATRGVVLSLTNDGFTMAGNGKQYTVKTTSSTTYNTHTKSVAVNDSVIVDGANTNGIISATRVNIENQ